MKFLTTAALGASVAAASRALTSQRSDAYAGSGQLSRSRGTHEATDVALALAKPSETAAKRSLLQTQATWCFSGSQTGVEIDTAQGCYQDCMYWDMGDNFCNDYLPVSVQQQVPRGSVFCGWLEYDFNNNIWDAYTGLVGLDSTVAGCTAACSSNPTNYVTQPFCQNFPVLTPPPSPQPNVVPPPSPQPNVVPPPSPQPHVVPPPSPNPVWTPGPGMGPITSGANAAFCLDVLVTAGTETVVSGETLDAMHCDNSATQQWVTANPNRAITVSGFCHDVVGGQAVSGAFLEAATCNGASSQQWTIAGQQIKAGDSNFCVDVLNGQLFDYMALVLQPCSCAATQTWHLP